MKIIGKHHIGFRTLYLLGIEEEKNKIKNKLIHRAQFYINIEKNLNIVQNHNKKKNNNFLCQKNFDK